MGRILVIDGDATRRIALAAALGGVPHDVEMAGAGQTGLSMAKLTQPELVIVEAPLPDASSIAMCLALRQEPTTARTLIVVTDASTEEGDRVAAFEAGADDYVIRPFSTRELLLRVRALLRRVHPQAPAEVIAIGDVRIDRGTRRVVVGSLSVDLTRREFDLLLRLVDGRGHVLARETLVADVWNDDGASERVVDTTLKRLRKKLPALGERIRTIRGIGYELTTEERGPVV